MVVETYRAFSENFGLAAAGVIRVKEIMLCVIQLGPWCDLIYIEHTVLQEMRSNRSLYGHLQES
jgi:hypothetical protein